MSSIESLDEPGRKEWEYAGKRTVNGVEVPLYHDRDFESTGLQRQHCIEHAKEGGVVDSLEADFLDNLELSSVNSETIIRIRTMCMGSCSIGECAARVVQYDAKGNQIS